VPQLLQFALAFLFITLLHRLCLSYQVWVSSVFLTGQNYLGAYNILEKLSRHIKVKGEIAVVYRIE
jgi:hypothetical protein